MAKPDPALLETARYPFAIDIPPRFQDLDPNHHINNVAMAAIFEEMRVRFDHALDMPAIMRGNGLRAMIASLQIEFLGEAFYPDPLSTCIGTLAIGRTSWTVAGLTGQGGHIACYMRGTVVCIGDNGPTPLPDALRTALADYTIRLGD